MAGANKFVDDMSRVVVGAAGVARGAMNEAETAMKGWTQKWVSEQGFVTRDEFEAVALMAKNARAECDELRKELDALRAEMKTSSAKPKTTRAKSGAKSGGAKSRASKTTRSKS